jgi:ankyrin repeat protein
MPKRGAMERKQLVWTPWISTLSTILVLTWIGGTITAWWWAQTTTFSHVFASKNMTRLRVLAALNPKALERTENGYTALCCAAGYQWIEGAQFLLDRGALINQATSIGLTPLHYFVGWGKPFPTFVPNTNMINFLISKGAKIDARDNLGRTPARCAAFIRKGIALEALLIAGADPDAPVNKYGKTCLMCCIDYDTMLILLKYGASVKTVDNNGNNILHYINRFSGEREVEKLLEAGAEINALNINNQTPLDTILSLPIPEKVAQDLRSRGIKLEISWKAEKIAHYLRSRGAKTGAELRAEAEAAR